MALPAYLKKQLLLQKVVPAVLILCLLVGGLADLGSMRPEVPMENREGALTVSERGREKVSGKQVALSNAENEGSDMDRPTVISERRLTNDGQRARASDPALSATQVPPVLSRQLKQERLRKSWRKILLAEAVRRARRSETAWLDLGEIALSYAQAGMRKEAEHFFREAIKYSRHPTEQAIGDRRLRPVLELMVRADFLKEVGLNLVLLQNLELRGAVTVKLVEALASQGNYLTALNQALRVQNVGALGESLETLARYEIRDGGIHQARQTLNLILQRDLRDRIYAGLAPVLTEVEGRETALSVVANIQDVKDRDRALAGIARTEARAGKPFEAVLSLMRDPFFHDATLGQLVQEEAHRGHLEQAQVFARRIGNPEQRVRALETLVKLQVKRGYFRRALNQARAIGDETARNRALHAVAVGEARPVGTRAARGTASLIGSLSERDRTLRRIAEEVAAGGQMQEALQTVSEVRDPGERAMAYAQLALGNARQGDERAALVRVSDAQRELARGTTFRKSEEVAGVLAEAYVEAGEWDAAFIMAESIRSSGRRDQTYRRMANRFGNSREIDLAEKSAWRIDQAQTRLRVLDQVALTHARHTSPGRAIDAVDRLDSSRQQVRFLVALASRG